MDIPQGFPASKHPPSKARLALMRMRNKRGDTWILAFVIILAICMGGYYWLEHYEVPKLRDKIEEEYVEPLSRQFEKTLIEKSLLTSEVRKLKNSINNLNREKREVVLRLKELEDEGHIRWQLKNEALVEQKIELIKDIQELSKRTVIEK
jgi:hypothetical protein